MVQLSEFEGRNKVRRKKINRLKEKCYKISYDTPQDAWRVANRKLKRSSQHTSKVYKCNHCGKFHLSSELKDIPRCSVFRR